MRFAIFASNSWWRGVSQDDHVVFFVRECDSEEQIANELDPNKDHELRFIKLGPGDYIHDTFGVDEVVCNGGM